jgi:hypothetical protein
MMRGERGKGGIWLFGAPPPDAGREIFMNVGKRSFK